MLRLITGRSFSGKTEEMLRLMKKSENAIYIVPEQYSFAAEKKVTHAFGMSGMGNPYVYSFRRLAYKMEEECGRNREDISSEARVMVLADIVKRLAPKLSLYGGAARRGDMAQESAVIVTMLKKYMVTKEKLCKAMEKTKSPLLKKKLNDCMIISEAYDEFLSEGYRDADDVLEGLRKNICESKSLCDKDIFIDSFVAFTPLEYAVIEAMLTRCKSVTVALCTFSEGDEFVTASRTRDRLIAMAKRCNVPFGDEIKLEGGMYTATDEMKALEKSFVEKSVFESKTDAVRLYAAKNIHNEAVAAAREVERLCRDKGYRYRDIVIVAREMGDYEKELSRAFERFSIPLFLDKKTPLSGESAAVFAAQAVKIISKGWRNEDVFGYMKTAFSPLEDSEADELENYCLEAGVRSRDWHSEESWQMKPSVSENTEVDEEYLKRVDLSRRRLTAPLLSLEKKIKGRKTGREFAVAFYEFLTECALSGKTEKIAEGLIENGEGEAAERMRQVYDLIINLLESFDSAFGEKQLNADDFINLIMAAMETVEIGVIPSTTDSVCAGSIDRARGHGAKAAIIIGANEGRFPLVNKSHGIFTDADKAELGEYDIELPPTSEGMIFMEESLVYGALTCATDYLYVSWCTSGEAAMPSKLVKRIRAVFPKAEVLDENEGLEDIEEIGSAKSTYEKFAARLQESCFGEVSEVWRTAVEYYKNNLSWQEKVNEIEKYLGYENRSEIIREELLMRRYGDVISTSVSRLEEFSRCPFSYFASVTLGLRERKELEVTAADSGTFLHEFVDLFGKGLEADGRTWRDIDKEYIDKKTDELAEGLMQGINRHLLETSPRVRNLFVELKRIAKKSVTMLSEHMKKGAFEPLGYEIVFDEKGDFKPMKLDLPNGQTIKLRGRVDRADVYENENGKFVRIIDYKSGDKKFSLSSIYQGFDLQLAVYLNAVCDQGGYESAGMLYFRIDDPVINASEFTDEGEIEEAIAKSFKMDGLVLADDSVLEAMDVNYARGSDVIRVKRKKDGNFDERYSSVATQGEFRAIKKHVTKTVKKLAEEILKGQAAVSPVKGACTWCEMKAFCGFDNSIRGCSYRYPEKLNDKDALMEIVKNAK